MKRIKMSRFARSTVKKPSRLTPFGTRISLFGVQNHRFSLFLDVSDVFAPKLHHKIMIWCPTIPFWIQSGPRRARPARPAGRAGWPSLAGPAGQPGRPVPPAGGLLCRGTREEQRREAAHRRTLPPPLHSYHRRLVISYSLYIPYRPLGE